MAMTWCLTALQQRGIPYCSMHDTKPSERMPVVSPEQFLKQLECGFKWNGGVLIDGDLIISGNDELLVIPDVTVAGFVAIERCFSLSSCSLNVDKDLSITDCPSLTKIKGRACDIRLARVGVEVIGADLEVGGDLRVEECPQFAKINCHVEGSLIVNGSPILRPGPAFSCGVASMVDSSYSWGIKPLPRSPLKGNGSGRTPIPRSHESGRAG